MKNIVAGTSGHIDHGKSALTLALTGIDPDRFEEEKKRGITIDIGFAHYIWRDELRVSLVDVPGHERFVHNMLAGAGGIRLVILTVAADGGVMPQTREHLYICHLLNIKHGIVAITRRDLADDEMTELVREEIEELTKSTFMEGKPVIETSVVTGQGLDELKEEIARQSKLISSDDLSSPFRLPIDRVFSLKGFGTIVTGAVLSGRASAKDELLLYPRQTPLRIRGFQVHQEKTDRVEAGQRSAVNLSGIHKNEIHRGDQIAPPGQLAITKAVEAELSIIPDKTGLLKHRGKIRFFSAAQEVTGRIHGFKDFDPQKTSPQYVRIRLEEPISCRYGDRFIIRRLSPLETVGGGKIIAPFANRSRGSRKRLEESLAGLAGEDKTARILEVVFLSGASGIEANKLPALTSCGRKTIQRSVQKLLGQGEIITVNPEKKKYVHKFHADRAAGFLARNLKIFHKKYPEKTGALGSDFFGKTRGLFDQREALALLDWAVKRKIISRDEKYFRLPGFQGGLNERQKRLKAAILEALLAKGFRVSTMVNLADELSLEVQDLEKLLKIGASQKWVVRIKDDLWCHPDIAETVKEKLLSHFEENPTLTVSEFKGLLDIPRKQAVGLLEYFDSLHLTRRVDNHRVPRQDAKRSGALSRLE